MQQIKLQKEELKDFLLEHSTRSKQLLENQTSLSSVEEGIAAVSHGSPSVIRKRGTTPKQQVSLLICDNDNNIHIDNEAHQEVSYCHRQDISSKNEEDETQKFDRHQITIWNDIHCIIWYLRIYII